MSSSIAKWGGWAGVVAARLFVLAGILLLIAALQRVLSSFSDYSVEVIVVVALALTLVAIVGLHALQSGRYG